MDSTYFRLTNANIFQIGLGFKFTFVLIDKPCFFLFSFFTLFPFLLSFFLLFLYYYIIYIYYMLLLY